MRLPQPCLLELGGVWPNRCILRLRMQLPCLRRDGSARAWAERSELDHVLRESKQFCSWDMCQAQATLGIALEALHVKPC